MPRLPWVAFILIISSPLLSLSWRLPELIPVHVFLFSVLIVPPLLVWTLVIRDDGMTLYRVNHLKWDEVRNARLIRIPGLPYMIVRRRKGLFRWWWVPLYFKGARDVRAAILERCPKDNPIRRCVESAAV
jgi:hypothetical protein